MYKHFFGLRENPFSVNPDPRFLYLTPSTRKALDEMTYAIQARKGLTLLTGEVGTGKTTLINSLLEGLRQQHTPTAFIFNSHLETSHLFDFILADFGVPFDSRVKGNALMRLNQWLIERFRAGETPVLIVDEAQGLPTPVLEDIRMLLNLETPHEKLLQIVLVSQPELEERLRRPELRQLKQRIALRCRTAALTLEETHEYVEVRLRIASVKGKTVFASQAIDSVYFYSRGIPRVVNLLCEHALINAFRDGVQPIPAQVVDQIAREFQIDAIKPVSKLVDFGDPWSGNLIAMQPTRAVATSHPLSDEQLFCRKESDARASTDPMSGVSAPFVAGGDTRATSEAASWAKDGEGRPSSDSKKEIIDSAAASAPAGPVALPVTETPGRGHAHQASGPATLDAEAGLQFLAELATERPAHTLFTGLRVVDGKAKADTVAARTAVQVSSAPSSAPQLGSLIPATKPTLAGRRKFLALRSSLIRPSTRWWDRSRSAIHLPAWGQISATLLLSLKRSFRPGHALNRRWYARRHGSPWSAGSSEWSEIMAAAFRWLQQPIKATRWHFPDSLMIESRRRLSQKKL